jgi:uncharacterized protein (DUF1330 family)
VSATMIVYMKLNSRDWMTEYFAEVPKLLAEYGASSVAAGYDISSVEGSLPPPDRMAVLSFPTCDAITKFLADPRYLRHRRAREQGSDSTIFVFDNKVTGGSELV